MPTRLRLCVAGQPRTGGLLDRGCIALGPVCAPPVAGTGGALEEASAACFIALRNSSVRCCIAATLSVRYSLVNHFGGASLWTRRRLQALLARDHRVRVRRVVPTVVVTGSERFSPPSVRAQPDEMRLILELFVGVLATERVFGWRHAE